MANLNNVIKILQNDYDTIVSAYPNSATISTGATITYDPNSLYLVESEGGGSRYLHNIQIVYSNTYIATFSFINSRSESYGNGTTTNWSALVTDLGGAGFNSANNTCPAQGQFYASGKTNILTGVYYVGTSSVMGFKGLTIISTSGTTMTINESAVITTGSLGSAATIYDVVTEL